VTIEGGPFVRGAVARWNGVDRPTTYVAEGQLSLQLEPSDYASVGTGLISVSNPEPGGGSSNDMVFTISANGVGPNSITVDPRGKFAYVASQGCSTNSNGSMSTYALNASTGQLTSLGPTVMAGYGARSMVVSPDGRFAYLAAPATGDDLGFVNIYALDATNGSPTLKNTGYAAGGITPSSIALAPSGRFAYVTDPSGFSHGGGTAVYVHAIDTTSGLFSQSFAGASGDALFIALDAAGKFAYVLGHSNPTGTSGGKSATLGIATYKVDSVSGALQFVGETAEALDVVAGNPWWDPTGGTPLAFDRSGRFAYVANSGANEILLYAIDAGSGLLSWVGSVAAGVNPLTLAVDPSNRFAYVTNSGSNTLSIYRLDPVTGMLTSAGTVTTGLAPNSMAFDLAGNFLYVTNRGSNDVWMFAIDGTSGVLTPIGKIGT
jgi:6-phosphogluconolactonase (cycloisomerase 2 family)